MEEVNHKEICELCGTLVVADRYGILPDRCDKEKNGYCGRFRVQAFLDAISFGMKQRKESIICK